MKGKVYFVGSGPGDPDLLTVKAHNLLDTADVVVYDALVTRGIVERISPNAVRIPVRKSPRGHGMNIEEIGNTLVSLALGGNSVVRLKSGDPLIFGRLWEETEFLDSAGIPYEIVPGITSALSSAAFARIPLTDRRFSSSVAIVTGHEARDKKYHSVDWAQLAKSVDTVIVLMGASNIAEYSRKILESGIEGNILLTVVCNASRNNQKILETTLAEAAYGDFDLKEDLCTVIISLGTLPVKNVTQTVKRRTSRRIVSLKAE